MTFSLFLLLCLLPFILASRIHELEKAVAEAHKADKCQQLLFSHKQKLLSAIDALGDCDSRRTLCAQRIVVQRQLLDCDDTCAHEKTKLDQVEAACRFIDGCSTLSHLKKQLAELSERTCPGSGKVASAEAALYGAVEEERVKLGIAKVPYKVKYIEPTDTPADAAVIVLHGVGQNVSEFESLARQVRFALPRTRIIMPQANEDYVTYFDDTMPSWFNILSDEVDGPQDKEGILKAAANIALIVEVQRRVFGIKADKVAVVGISQGGALALTTYMRYVTAGVVSASGFLPLANSYPAEMGPAIGPALLLHGGGDDLVPVDVARLSRDVLRGVGRVVEYVEFGGEGHGLDGVRWQVGLRVAEFLRDVLDKEGFLGF